MPFYRTTCASRHSQLRTGGFCWNKVFPARLHLLTATNTFILRRCCQSSPQRGYLHLHTVNKIASVKVSSHLDLVTFRLSRSQREMYCVHPRLCVCMCLSVCLSVRGRTPTLLHGPECNLGEWYRLPRSCALLGGFAIGARVALLWQHNPNAKCWRVRARTRSMPSCSCGALSKRCR